MPGFQTHFTRLEQQLTRPGPTCDCHVGYELIEDIQLASLDAKVVNKAAWTAYFKYHLADMKR